MLKSTGTHRQALFTAEERQGVYARNTGLNARQLADLFRKVKRDYTSRLI